MIFLFIFIILALVSEAFFSGTETAFISVNFLKLMHLIEKKNKYALAVHDLLKKPDRLLTTTLIGTNLSVVISSACATALFARLTVTYSALLTTLVMTPISFVFCQLLSKTISRYKANRLVLYLAGPLKAAEKIFFPFVVLFTTLANSIARIINPKGLKKNPFLTKDEIKSLIKDISREGILTLDEKEAINKIFDMTLTRAADIMILLKSAVTLDSKETVEEIKEKCRRASQTRFAVFDGKALKGVLNIFDLFYAATTDWLSLVKPMMRLENDESLDKVFSKMQPGRERVAAVFKGEDVVGILEIEDLLEEVTSKLASPITKKMS